MIWEFQIGLEHDPDESTQLYPDRLTAVTLFSQPPKLCTDFESASSLKRRQKRKKCLRFSASPGLGLRATHLEIF
jgi:hypothetical protein